MDHDKYKYHVKEREGFDDKAQSEEDLERLQSAWGDRHRPLSQYLHARDGDHLITPFECDLCIFRKLRRESPNLGSQVDDRLLAGIRRINLDAFWSRSASTVSGNKDRVAAALRISKSLGLEGPYFNDGPMPDYDYCGYELALQMVEASRKPGRYSKDYTQFDTIRKYRSLYASFNRVSPQGNRLVLAMVNHKGKLQRFVQDPTVTVWFQRVVEGCERRMGNVWKPNENCTGSTHFKPLMVHMKITRIKRKKLIYSYTYSYKKKLHKHRNTNKQTRIQIINGELRNSNFSYLFK